MPKYAFTLSISVEVRADSEDEARKKFDACVVSNLYAGLRTPLVTWFGPHTLSNTETVDDDN